MDVTNALQNYSAALSEEEQTTIRNELSTYLNYLLLNDFAALVQILYRVDVSEQKLKEVLQQNKQADAGDLLTNLIIERQLQKAIYRSETKTKDMPDEERW